MTFICFSFILCGFINLVSSVRKICVDHRVIKNTSVNPIKVFFTGIELCLNWLLNTVTCNEASVLTLCIVSFSMNLNQIKKNYSVLLRFGAMLFSSTSDWKQNFRTMGFPLWLVEVKSYSVIDFTQMCVKSRTFLILEEKNYCTKWI